VIKALLAHPYTRGLDLDDPATTGKRRAIVNEKPFLRAIYHVCYAQGAAAPPRGEGAVLELGSGAGFLQDYVEGLITSEVFFCEFVRTVLDGHALPFRANALRGLVMTNVLHHIPDPHRFLREAASVVRPGGVVAMIEPWNTPWSRFVYTRLHHEPFMPDAAAVGVVRGGPLSDANGALPWILFERDRRQFERDFPAWRIETVRPMMPFRYLVSGGVSMRTLMPSWTTGMWRAIERVVDRRMAMFALIVLRRTESADVINA
jgi:SAM-dependent methyltransferase